jgi:hypothetical protein
VNRGAGPPYESEISTNIQHSWPLTFKKSTSWPAPENRYDKQRIHFDLCVTLGSWIIFLTRTFIFSQFPEKKGILDFVNLKL